MPDAKFAVVRDQDGDAKDASMKDFSDLQAQGYRVADVSAYHAAMDANAEPHPAHRSAPGEAAMAEQGSADASDAAAAQNPAAKPAAADKTVKATEK